MSKDADQFGRRHQHLTTSARAWAAGKLYDHVVGAIQMGAGGISIVWGWGYMAGPGTVTIKRATISQSVSPALSNGSTGSYTKIRQRSSRPMTTVLVPPAPSSSSSNFRQMKKNKRKCDPLPGHPHNWNIERGMVVNGCSSTETTVARAPRTHQRFWQIAEII